MNENIILPELPDDGPEGLRGSYRRVFSGPDGEKVLAHLAARNFIATSANDPNPAVAAHNEGRRFVVLNIFHLLAEPGATPTALQRLSAVIRKLNPTKK